MGFTHYHWLVLGLTSLLVVAVVLVHYETFGLLTRLLKRLHFRPRGMILVVMFGLLIAHVVEIWFFGAGYWLVLQHPALGRLAGVTGNTFPACIYFSSSTYTTLGYGDITPAGPLRLLASSEALTGFMLITWSASFTYLQMERFWQGR
ncbi:MAG: potassium channel family protein [Gammaproteobacteria bacterium]|jgi:hypothetical protein